MRNKCLISGALVIDALLAQQKIAMTAMEKAERLGDETTRDSRYVALSYLSDLRRDIESMMVEEHNK